MAPPYAVDVLKLIDLAAECFDSRSNRLQEMYQESLEPEQYGRAHAKHEPVMSEKFQLLRASVEIPRLLQELLCSLDQPDLFHVSCVPKSWHPEGKFHRDYIIYRTNPACLVAL